MKVMKKLFDCTPLWYKLVILFDVLLTIGAFIAPPIGVIDMSVIAAVGEISTFAFLGMLPHYLKNGKSIKVQHGDTSVHIGGEHGMEDHVGMVDDVCNEN